MKVLALHNHYQEPGGEDVVFRAETALLETYGHSVVRYTADNAAIGATGAARHALRAIWNAQAVRDLQRVIRDVHPDVMHVHNTLAVLSPAVYRAATRERVPVVQTLHNYRLLCPGANLYRDGRICEACIGRRVAWPGVMHACYRGDARATAVVAAIRTTHDLIGTWGRVHRYIAPSAFAKQKFVDAGWADSAIVVKPNFVDPDPGVGRHQGGYGLFAGRLSAEKGLPTLLAAQRLLPDGGPPLRIAGTGATPDHRAAAHGRRVEWLGQRTPQEVHALMREAAFLVFPSECYETFGLAIVEAFATGLPVITCRHGAMAELVRDGETGLHFSPGDAHDLASKIDWALSHRDELAQMGRRCRAEFEARYTARHNHALLMAVYRTAVQSGRSGRDDH